MLEEMKKVHLDGAVSTLPPPTPLPPLQPTPPTPPPVMEERQNYHVS